MKVLKVQNKITKSKKKINIYYLVFLIILFIHAIFEIKNEVKWDISIYEYLMMLGFLFIFDSLKDVIEIFLFLFKKIEKNKKT